MVRTGARPTTTTTTHLLGGVTHGDSDSSQVARGSSRLWTASSLSSVDQTAHFLLAAPNPGRPWPKQGRAGGRKCALATAPHHPRAAGETASMHENGSPAPRSPGKNASDLEANDRLDQGDGERKPALGCRTDPGGTAETWHPCVQAHHPGVFEKRPYSPATR